MSARNQPAESGFSAVILASFSSDPRLVIARGVAAAAEETIQTYTGGTPALSVLAQFCCVDFATN